MSAVRTSPPIAGGGRFSGSSKFSAFRPEPSPRERATYVLGLRRRNANSALTPRVRDGHVAPLEWSDLYFQVQRQRAPQRIGSLTATPAVRPYTNAWGEMA